MVGYYLLYVADTTGHPGSGTEERRIHPVAPRLDWWHPRGGLPASGPPTRLNPFHLDQGLQSVERVFRDPREATLAERRRTPISVSRCSASTWEMSYFLLTCVIYQ